MSCPTEGSNSALLNSEIQSAGDWEMKRSNERRHASTGIAPLGRLLLTSSSFPRWTGDSTAPFVLHLAQDLQALGWRVDLLAPHAPRAALHEQIEGISVERFRYCWPESLETVCYQGGALVNLRNNRTNFAKLPLFVFAEWAAIVRKLARGHYDLLNSHWLLPQGFTGVLSAKPFRVPHIVTVHGSDIFALRHPVLARTKAFTLRHADAVTVNSTATAGAVEKIAPGLANLHRIPMGVSEGIPDLRRVHQLRQTFRRHSGPLLIFLGRLIQEKGVSDVIRAVPILASKHPNTTALIVGDGPDRSEFEWLSEQSGHADRISFVGCVDSDQVFDYLAAGDIFVGPSRRSIEGGVEGQGLTFAEAMLAGTPVVATAIGGISDTVQHEETGLLVEEASPQQIADSISRLIESPEFCQQLINQAGRFARANLTRQRSADSFSKLFSRCLRRARMET